MMNLTEYVEKENSLSSSDTLWEDYSIEILTKHIDYISKNENRVTRLNIYEYLLLQNLFLIRRIRDAGFLQYICKEILTDKEFFKFAQQFIRHSIATRLLNSFPFYNPFFKMEGWDDIINPRILPKFNFYDEKIILSNKNLNKKRLEYFDYCITFARKNLQLNRLKAISSLKEEYEKKKFKIWKIVLNEIGDPILTEHHIKGFRQNLDMNRINFNGVYMSPLSDEHLVLFDEIPEFTQLYFIIVKEISSFLNISLEKAIHYNKFIKDLISIINLKWFIVKTKADQWKIINKIYSFNLSDKNLEKLWSINNKSGLNSSKMIEEFENIYNTSLNDEIKKQNGNKQKNYPTFGMVITDIPINFHFLYITAKKLTQLGILSEGINIYNFLLRKTEEIKVEKKRKKIKTFFLIEQAWLLFQKQDYKSAVKQYEQSCISLTENDLYVKMLVLKNCAELYFKLKFYKSSEEKYSELLKLEEKFSSAQKVSYLWNLANSFRNTQKFKKEHRTLMKLLSLKFADLPENVENLAKIRLNELEQPNYMISIGDFDSISLNNLQETKKIDKLIDNYRKFCYSFNYNEANKIIYELIQLKCTNAHAKNVYFNHLHFFKNLDCNLDFLNMLRENQISNPFFEIFLITLNLIKGKNIDYSNYDLFLRDYKPYIPIRNELELYSLSIEDLPAISWIIDPLKIYCKNDEEIKNKLNKIITNLTIKMPYYFWNDIGKTLTNSGYFDLGMYYYEIALKKQTKKKDCSIIRNNIAMNYYKQDKFLDCANILEELIIEKKNPIYLLNLLECYEALYNIPRAREIMELINEKEWNDMIISQGLTPISFKEKIEELKMKQETFVNFNLVNDQEIRNLILSADNIFIHLSEASFEMDYSLIIVAYCKAVEKLLHNILTVDYELPDDVYRIYESNNRIKNNIWKKLNPAMKSLLSNPQKSISLGAWVYVFRESCGNLDRIRHIPYYVSFINYIKNKISKKKRRILKGVCDNLVNYRNDSAHVIFATKEDFLDAKPDLLKSINSALSILNETVET